MNTSKTRRQTLAVIALTVLAGSAFAQQPYPGKPIRLVLPYPPGGGSSIIAHLLSDKLRERWGQSLVVENRGGGGGVIAANAVMQAPADGYTVLMASPAQMVINPILLPVPYDPIRDFTAVTTLYSFEMLMVVNPKVPAKNLREFIALARAQPGKLNFGVVGVGGTTHLAGELLNVQANIKTQPIAYKGAGPAMQDLIGGQVQFSFVAPAAAMGFVRNSELRAMAVSGKNRLTALPDVPTFAEAGLPDFYARSWFGIFARSGTPKPVVDQLAKDFAYAMSLPEMKEKLTAQGLDLLLEGSGAFSALMKEDQNRYAELIKIANVKVQ